MIDLNSYSPPFLCNLMAALSAFVVVGLLLASGTKVMSKSKAVESMTLPYQALACPPITTIYLETRPPPQRELHPTYVHGVLLLHSVLLKVWHTICFENYLIQ